MLGIQKTDSRSWSRICVSDKAIWFKLKTFPGEITVAPSAFYLVKTNLLQHFFDKCSLQGAEPKGFLKVVPQNFNLFSSFGRRFSNGWMHALQMALSRVSNLFHTLSRGPCQSWKSKQKRNRSTQEETKEIT